MPTEPQQTDLVSEARAAFVIMVKSENVYAEPWSRQSLKQHWNGARDGFADELLQKRWKDFLAGWKAAKGERYHDN